jgi:hypothetical protein
LRLGHKKLYTAKHILNAVNEGSLPVAAIPLPLPLPLPPNRKLKKIHRFSRHVDSKYQIF